MAKNIKWIKVDSVTGVSEATAKATNGAVNPNLSGLTETFDWGLSLKHVALRNMLVLVWFGFSFEKGLIFPSRPADCLAYYLSP